MDKKIRVMVVDDHPFFRNGIIHWMQRQESLEFCGEAGSIAEARRLARELRPDVILMDLRLGDGDALDLIPEIIETLPRTRVLVISQFDEETFAHRALKAGARGYLMKSEATDTALEAIQKIMQGDTYISRRVVARLADSLFPDPISKTPDLARLSDRELQVFQMIGAGAQTRDIAERLKISPKTVDTYRENLKNKLHLANGSALIKAATNWVEHGRLLDA